MISLSLNEFRNDINEYTPGSPKTISTQNNFILSIFICLFLCSFLSLNANTQSLILNLDSKGFISVFTDHVFSGHFYLKSWFVFLSGVFFFSILCHCFVMVLSFLMWSCSQFCEYAKSILFIHMLVDTLILYINLSLLLVFLW